jgi:hypothetical protein
VGLGYDPALRGVSLIEGLDHTGGHAVGRHGGDLSQKLQEVASAAK